MQQHSHVKAHFADSSKSSMYFALQLNYQIASARWQKIMMTKRDVCHQWCQMGGMRSFGLEREDFQG